MVTYNWQHYCFNANLIYRYLIIPLFFQEHSKRRNRPHQQGMNDLVYVMYNLQLTGRDENKRKEQQITGLETLNLNDVSSDDKWILQEESFNDNI